MMISARGIRPYVEDPRRGESRHFIFWGLLHSGVRWFVGCDIRLTGVSKIFMCKIVTSKFVAVLSQNPHTFDERDEHKVRLD
jgi:hypothetical protein